MHIVVHLVSFWKNWELNFPEHPYFSVDSVKTHNFCQNCIMFHCNICTIAYHRVIVGRPIWLLIVKKCRPTSVPFRAKFPAKWSKHQWNDNSIEEANCSILRIPPVRQILLPKTSQELIREWSRIFCREIYFFRVTRWPAETVNQLFVISEPREGYKLNKSIIDQRWWITWN